MYRIKGPSIPIGTYQAVTQETRDNRGRVRVTCSDGPMFDLDQSCLQMMKPLSSPMTSGTVPAFVLPNIDLSVECRAFLFKMVLALMVDRKPLNEIISVEEFKNSPFFFEDFTHLLHQFYYEEHTREVLDNVRKQLDRLYTVEIARSLLVKYVPEEEIPTPYCVEKAIAIMQKAILFQSHHEANSHFAALSTYQRELEAIDDVIDKLEEPMIWPYTVKTLEQKLLRDRWEEQKRAKEQVKEELNRLTQPYVIGQESNEALANAAKYLNDDIPLVRKMAEEALAKLQARFDE